STLAYADHIPILLTTPSSLSPQALSAFEALDIRQVIVMGGELAVSDTVVRTLEAHGISVLRVAGADYTDTAIELAECELAASTSDVGLGWHATGKLAVARGDYYSDGLAGAVVAADGPADVDPVPLLLTASPTSMGSYLPTFLGAAGTAGLDGRRIVGFTVLGGPLAVSQSVVNTLEVSLLGS
ncbi:MAG TPA: cell wall-binding repeat-containing protein, partial [Acidimicrobiales bacterium]|nr:cell wall-binding repeat-containing protein [Acidimicrobiales bacterium]